MKVIIQRVKRASCTVDDNIISSIERGYLLLIGFTTGDTKEMLPIFVNKIINMRIFEDENDKLNLSIKDIDGSILAISQFTLYADCKKGNRPSFTKAMAYTEANTLYEEFVLQLNQHIITKKGMFGEHMYLDFINDGPVTIILDSDDLVK